MTPDLSVVVTITIGEQHLERCLRALAAQQSTAKLEILVPVFPWDNVQDLAARYPSVLFLPARTREGARPEDPGHEHLGFDARRAAGLAAASAPIVAMLEDHAIPRPDWCARILDAHDRYRWAAIGGSIVPAPGASLLSQAIHACDFGRYEHPRQGPAAYISDVNVSYKREYLELIHPIWREVYHETWVHDALSDLGAGLWLEPGIVVEHDRGATSLGALIEERFCWARLFAGRRAQKFSIAMRLVMALLCPVLPFVLLSRRARTAVQSNNGLRRFLGYAPAMFLLLSAWSAGECAGYLTARVVSGDVSETSPQLPTALPPM